MMARQDVTDHALDAASLSPPGFQWATAVAPPVPRLRTAWKRKQDTITPPPGKLGAKVGRGTARPGPNGVRAHVPATSGSPQLAPPAPPLPPLSMLPPPPPRLHTSGQGSPLTRVSSTPVMPPMQNVVRTTNPKARPRGSTRFQPGGTINAPAVRRQTGRAGRWFGNALIAVGLLIAVGVVGTTSFTQRVQQNEQEDFLASLGPTPTPLTLRATVVAVGIASNSTMPAPGAGLSVSRPGSGGITTEPPLALPPATGTPAAVAALGGGNTPLPAAPQPAPPAPAVPADAPRVVQPTTAVLPLGAPAVIGGDAISPDGRRTATAAAAMMPAPVRAATPTPTVARRTGAVPTTAPRPQIVLPTATPRPMMVPTPPMTPEAVVIAAVEPTPEAIPAPTAAPTPEPEPTATPTKPKMPVPNRIAIPVVGVNAPIIEVGISPVRVEGQDVYIWDVAAYAVGHHFSSANPGEGENIVLSGHNDWEGEVFRDLWKLKKGARITVSTSERQWNYAVEDVVLLKEVGVPLEQRLSNAQYIAATGDDRLTLVTCWPYGVDDYRLVVIARPGP